MPASITVPPELAKLARGFGNSAAIERRVGKTVADSGRAVAGARPPRYASKISNRVVLTRDGFTATSSGELAAGAEFGGRRRRKQTYATRSPRGTVYAVTRRTTQQFLPWTGSRGYALMPAMRRGMSGIRQRILDAVRQAVTRG